jgi:hypothetical protein
MNSPSSYRYCGRIFTPLEINRIRQLIAAEPKRNRLELSKAVCEQFQWRRPDGRLKDMSCRVAMLRMHRDGLICLPAPQSKNGNGKTRPKISSASDPQKSISLPAGELGRLFFRPISTQKDSYLWNELIERYHYLGYKPLPGAQIRYLVFSSPKESSTSGNLLAALGFGAAAWKVAPRDRFIDWTPQQRLSNLHLIVNNARFLILPWVTSKNLASRILSGVAKQLPHDWQSRYNYTPVLLETFVQKDRFKGSCYRAANWKLLGQTQGRGKLDRYNNYSLPIKDIFVYPLNKSFKNILAHS